jgi:hypothetical protein
MLGKSAVVIEDIDPEGKIGYASEIWDAVSRDTPLFNGTHVRINKASGLRVDVEPIAGAGTSRHTLKSLVPGVFYHVGRKLMRFNLSVYCRYRVVLVILGIIGGFYGQR